jgi:hypothetical protein
VAALINDLPAERSEVVEEGFFDEGYSDVGMQRAE